MTEDFLDVVGNWTTIKLKIVEEYAKAYARILAKQERLKFSYIDAFAGAGSLVSRDTGEEMLGSSMKVLAIEPKFNHYYFIDMNHARASRLREMTAKRKDVTILEGDSNQILLKDVFPKCQYIDYCRALCLFDPYALNPAWEVVEAAGRMRSIEIILNFMIMDANRNVLWGNPEKVRPDQIERMNVFWGDGTWKDAAYKATPGLFGEMTEKLTNEAVVDAYRKRLKEEAGFKFVPDPVPIKNTRGAVLYYLFFASQKATANKIANHIFRKYSAKGR